MRTKTTAAVLLASVSLLLLALPVLAATPKYNGSVTFNVHHPAQITLWPNVVLFQGKDVRTAHDQSVYTFGNLYDAQAYDWTAVCGVHTFRGQVTLTPSDPSAVVSTC